VGLLYLYLYIVKQWHTLFSCFIDGYSTERPHLRRWYIRGKFLYGQVVCTHLKFLCSPHATSPLCMVVVHDGRTNSDCTEVEDNKMPPTLFLNWGHRHRTLHHDCLFCSSSNSSASGAKDCIHPRMIPREPPANTWIPDSKISVLAGCNIAFYFTTPVFSPLNPGTWITSLDMLKSLSSMSVTIVSYLCDGKNYENSIKNLYVCFIFLYNFCFRRFLLQQSILSILRWRCPQKRVQDFM